MSFDLHTHSLCSDGTQPPADVVAAAATLRHTGLQGLALTDHDTTRGWDEAETAARLLGVTFVAGAELSCQLDRFSVHMLSYLHDPDHPALKRELDRTRESRLTRAERMVASLGTEYPITWQDVLVQVGSGATVGRPHIADALVAAGVVERRADAFIEMLSTRSRHYVPYYTPDALTIVQLVRDAGGVAVLAHGLAAHRGRVLDVSQIETMIDAGMAGCEVYHREHGRAEVETLLGLARRYDLIVTGSSDYHGTGKENLLGENRTDRENLDRIATLGSREVIWAP